MKNSHNSMAKTQTIPIRKWTEDLNRHFSRQEAHGRIKMLNIANHQGNANQNHNAMSLHTWENGCHQNDKKRQVFTRTWRKRNPVHPWLECKLAQPPWKTYGASAKNEK